MSPEQGDNEDKSGEVLPHASSHIASATVLAAAFIGLSVGYSATYFWSSGLFLLPIASDLHLGRAQASLGPLCSWITAAVAIPFYGRLLDRVGARVIAIISLVGLGTGYLLIVHFATDLKSYLLCSLATAILGSGSTALPYSRLVLAMFTKRRGLALGIALTGTGLASICLPLLLPPIMASSGWRAAYFVLACLVLGAAAIIAVLLIPSSRKLEPAQMRPVHGGLHPVAVFKDARFALIGVSFLTMALSTVTIVVHFVALVTDAGIPMQTAATLASVMGGASLGARICTGILLDRFPPEKVAVALIGIAGIGVTCLFITSWPTMLAGALAIGFVMGAEVDMLAFLTARHFPTRYYGTAFGGVFSLFFVGGALGPLLAGTIFDRTGAYDLALVSALGALGISALTMLQLDRKPARASTHCC